MPFVLMLIKSQTQPDGGEGYSGIANRAISLALKKALVQSGLQTPHNRKKIFAYI
jgi:hypothetical protein